MAKLFAERKVRYQRQYSTPMISRHTVKITASNHGCEWWITRITVGYLWRDVGLQAPEVEERFGNPDRTILTLPLISNTTTNNTTTNITTSDDAGDDDKLQVILAFCDEPRSRAEIQEHLGIKSERYIREILLSALLKDGRLARTIPDKPRSVKQKYITTKTETERAQAIIDNNPVSQLSPDNLIISEPSHT